MPVINSIAAQAAELAHWRRDLHRWPEIGHDCHQTARFVAARLREFGADDIREGLAGTGIVALIHGHASGPAIGLRADMDALPMEEETGLDHASQVPGAMHGCGHDGHAIMLLGAARYLAETRNFAGTAVLIFQPAEEEGTGAAGMLASGVFEDLDLREIYALHNFPGMGVGHFATTRGPIMAAVDTFEIHVDGQGGHGAKPHEAADPVIAACAIVQALQTIVSRNVHTLDKVVLSVTQIHSGSADNVIPSHAWINGTVRSFDRDVQALVRRRMAEVVAGQAASFGVTARLDYVPGEPAAINDPDCAVFAAHVAAQVGEAQMREAPEMWGEDFSHFLDRIPGAFVFVGNGDSAALHHPRYDFNDEAAPHGASFFARLIEEALPMDGPIRRTETG